MTPGSAYSFTTSYAATDYFGMAIIGGQYALV